jgi:hypothetical protein
MPGKGFRITFGTNPLSLRFGRWKEKAPHRKRDFPPTN